MTENEDVKTKNGEQKPKRTCASGTNDLESTINELQRQLATAKADRAKYRRVLDNITKANISLAHWIDSAEACQKRIRELIANLGK